MNKIIAKFGSQESGYYPFFISGILWLVCLLNFADRQVIYAVFPLLEKEFHFSKFQLGMLGSSFLWVYALFALLGGWIVDRYSRKSIIVIGCFFWSVMTWVTGWASLFWHFFMIRGADGLGEAFFMPAATGMLADYHLPQKRSTIFAFFSSGIYLGIIAGGSFGAWLAERFGWRMPFYFFGGMGMLLALFLKRVIKEPQRGASEQEGRGNLLGSLKKEVLEKKEPLSLWQSFQVGKNLCRRVEIFSLMLSFGLSNIVAFSFFAWIPTLFFEKFHLSLAQAGFSAVFYLQIAGIVGGVILGKLTELFLGHWKGGILLIQIISLFLGAGCVLFIGRVTDLNQLILLILCFGFVKGGYEAALFPALYEVVPPHSRGIASGINSFIGSITGAFGPMMIGAIASFGSRANAMARMSMGLSWSAIFYLIAALFLMIALLKQREVFPLNEERE